MLLKQEVEHFYIHVYIPLVGRRVEESPAGCVLRRHHTPVQTTQHGHHVVLDGTCSCEVLEELRPGGKPPLFTFYCFYITTPSGFTCFLKVCPDLCFMYQKMVAQPNPVATLRCESGLGREDRKLLLQRPSCQVIS